MPYTPNSAWADSPSTSTPITAARLQNMEDGIDTAHDGVDNHIADTSDAHDASAISVVPFGTISSVNVQTTLEELEADILGSGIPATVFDNKGELLGSTAADAVGLVTAATANSLVLTSDSTQATGMKWAAVGTMADLSDVEAGPAITGEAPVWTGTEFTFTDVATQAELNTHAAAADPHAVYVLESLIDAKGDILTATAADTPARLAVGATAGQVLTVDSAEATGMKWASPDLLAINAQTATTYTLVLTDLNKLVELSNAAAITMTVPANSSVAFDVGSQIHLVQTGAGQVTFVGAAGVTVNGASLLIGEQWGAVTLIKRATNTWLLIGLLA